MSVRVNLLPEARILKLKNQQTKRFTILVSGAIIVGVLGALAILLILLLGRNFQFNQNKNKIADLQKQIADKGDVEKDTAWFNAALDNSTKLSDNRILISQLFDRLTEAVPKNVNLTDVSVDPTYKVKASVQAPDLNTVALFGDALQSYNITNRFIPGFARKSVFTDVKIDSVSSGKGGAVAGIKIFDVTFQLDKDLVQKFREDSKKAAAEANGGTQ